MNKRTRMELVLQGVRFASNMLVEMIGNHVRERNGFSEDSRRLLSDAAKYLSDAQYSVSRDIQLALEEEKKT